MIQNQFLIVINTTLLVKVMIEEPDKASFLIANMNEKSLKKSINNFY